MGYSVLVLILFSAVACLLASQQLLHFFQLESYQFPGYFRSLKRNWKHALLPGAALAVTMTAGMLVFHLAGRHPLGRTSCGVLSLCLLLVAFLLFRFSARQKAKKPLVYTPRMKRLQVVCFLFFTVLMLVLVGGSENSLSPLPVFFLLLPLNIALAGLLAWPLEKAISELYFRDAQRILREHPDLIRIGITGSWGKTSVKFILGSLLSEKYSTLITPASYNTPMGVTRVIRSQLLPGHRVFVAEMGARHVGDIREMCRLVHPSIGILTSVGEQHLDTFHTLDNIKKTKYELIDAVPAEGHCFFADDNGIVLGLYHQTSKPRSLAGLDPEQDDVWAEDIRVSPEGSTFFLCTREQKVPCKTQLLGELNIRNIVLCAAVCLKLDMTLSEIASGISRLRPVEHRLQLLNPSGGVNVIDDAFNSNIRGATQAFNVLKDFPGKRIVVTPGMVELGSREEEMNREFGRAMAPCCDLAVLVGKKRAAAIADGLKQAGFAPNRIVTVSSLVEATEYLTTAVQKGDTILFENDLPDNYQES